MRLRIFFFISIFCFEFSFAQIWEDQLLKTRVNPNVFEKIDAFEVWRDNVPYIKGNGYNPYARSLDFLEKRTSPNKPFRNNAQFLEWQKQNKKYKALQQANSSNWQPLGPFDTPIILSNGKKRGNGRVNCIAFDPIDSNIIWIGSPSGGLWKTSDGGNNWTTNTDNLPVIGVSGIAIHPNNNQIMYLATGDADGADTYSVGLLKSVDGGNSWNTTGLVYSVSQSVRINKLLLNPDFPDSLILATNSGIFISPDGANTWVNTLTGRIRDMKFKPNDPSLIYAALDASSGASKIYKSSNGGLNWAILSNGLPNSGLDRILLGVTYANPEIVYALIAKSDAGFYGFYKSSNSGNTWDSQLICTDPSNSGCNILGRSVDGTSEGGQSWYDMSLAISPIDENLVYVGGINLWKSIDGGNLWGIEASSGNASVYSYMHVDQHALEFNPLNNALYAGNDGGLYKYVHFNNLDDWIDLSDGLEISQFYKLGLSNSNPNVLVAGAQDNGTERLSFSGWDAIRGGDGMECIIDPNDPDIIYSSTQYGNIKVSYDGGSNWNSIKPVNYDGAWVTPYKMHPMNFNFLVAGYNEVYRSNSGGAFWDSISYNVSNGQLLRTIALAPSDIDVIYAASYTTLQVTFDGGLNWTNIKPGLYNSTISDVVVAPHDPNLVWVTFSNYDNNQKIYHSSDGGNTWVNISGSNLPNLPVNCIVYQDFANEDLYIGTDLGVYHKNKNMSDWQPFMTNLPNVIISELEIHYSTAKIRAATYGRGIWESPLQNSPNSIIANDFFSACIYPNPTKNHLIVNLPENTLVNNPLITIFDLTGKVIISEKISSTKQFISLSLLKPGCYLYRLSANNSTYLDSKIIVLPD